MLYRISYETSAAAPTAGRRAQRTEYFATQHAALGRARDLLDGAEHEAVVVHDDDGSTLTGIRLQLALGASATD